MEIIESIARSEIPMAHQCPVCLENSSESNREWSVHTPSGIDHPIHTECFEEIKRQGQLCSVCKNDVFNNNNAGLKNLKQSSDAVHEQTATHIATNATNNPVARRIIEQLYVANRSNLSPEDHNLIQDLLSQTAPRRPAPRPNRRPAAPVAVIPARGMNCVNKLLIAAFVTLVIGITILHFSD